MSPEHLHQVLHATAHLFRPGSTKHAVITTLASDHEAIKGVQTMESLFDKLPKRLVDDPLTRNVLWFLARPSRSFRVAHPPTLSLFWTSLGVLSRHFSNYH
jgi:hypothetical protein